MRTALVLAAASTTAALALSGCGSDSTSATSLGTSSGDSSTSSGTAEAVAAAKASVEKLLVRPTDMEVPPLPKAPDKGKTLAFVACGVPACQSFVPYLKQATDAVGWKLRVVDSGVTPQSITAAWDQVVREKPAGVIASGGISPDVFAKQLAQLDKLGVPVVVQVVPPSDLPGLTAIVYGKAETKFNGQQMADYVLADSGGKDVHLGIVSTPATPVYGFAHEALKETLGDPSKCESCTVDTFSFPITDLGPNLPSKVVSYVRANPDINYLFMDFANEVDGVPAALERAGLQDRVKIVTIDIQSTQAAYMKAGQNLIATAANPWPEILWTEAGIIFAADQGADVEAAKSVKLPVMTLDKSNLIDSKGEAYFPLVENYQAIFKKAWKVG